MENTVTQKKYELMIILDANMNDSDKEAIIKSAADVVNKSGAKVINSQVWLEKHKLTFDIKKKKEGTYYLLNIEGDSTIVAKVRSDLRLNEKILRFSIIKVD